MRCKTPSVWALTGLCALSIGCSGDDPEPTAPAPVESPASLEGAALSLYGVGPNGPGQGCRAAEYRQFDFWLGSWQVAVNGNPPVPASFITGDLDGCAIIENWRAPGSTARSLS
ncbi:MAG: hypothetical protein ABJC36_12575, partial [Gemmatimonadales bacterium]